MIPNWLKDLAHTSREHELLAKAALRRNLHNLAYYHQLYAEQLKKKEIDSWWTNNVRSVLP